MHSKVQIEMVIIFFFMVIVLGLIKLFIYKIIFTLSNPYENLGLEAVF